MLDIILTTPELIVVNKPPLTHSVDRVEAPQSPLTSQATNVHPSHLPGSSSIATLLREQFPETASASPHTRDSGLVNRLDFETSGILIAARDRLTWNRFHSLFTHGATRKEYLVLASGTISSRSSIEGYIGTEARRGRKVYFTETRPRQSNRYQISLSVVEPLCHTAFPASLTVESQPSPVTPMRGLPEETATVTLARIITHTGRRHQVRVHLATLGHPLFGDQIYQPREHRDFLPPLSQRVSELTSSLCPPFFLHAAKVSLPPEAGLPFNILTAPLPQHFTLALQLLDLSIPSEK